MSNLTQIIKERYKAADDYLEQKRGLWDTCDQLLVNQLNDGISAKTKSSIVDPKLATMAIERSNRVMAQLPTGKFNAMSRNDAFCERLMNLMMDKYVVPNAKAQFDFLIKLRMIDLYSNVYGNMFTFIDHDVKPNGYIGPDMWMLNIRDVFPQVGAMSLEDSDYVIIRTWKPLSYFENLKKNDGYKNIPEIINKLKDTSGDKHKQDSKTISPRQEKGYPNTQPAKSNGYFEVLSMYERDRWVDYVSGADLVFRDQKNPHENGELPVVCKYSIPLIDDFMGMGDFERGYPMQKSLNGLWNLYMDAVKTSIYPPVLINKDNIAVMSSLKYGAAEKWLVRGPNIDNTARPLQLNPQGISTFNNAYQVITAAMMNQFGTTDTAVTQQTDPGFGKTPQALEMQQQRENARDNADRFYMEQFLKQVYNRMGNLLINKMPSSLPVRLFEDEIKELELLYPEVSEAYNEKTGKLTIKKKKMGKILFDYEMVSGSTYSVNQKEQQSNLLSMLELITSNKQVSYQGQPMGLMDYLEMVEGKKFMPGELITRIMANSGVQDWDKILVDSNKEKESPTLNGEDILGQHAQEFSSLFAQPQNIPPMPQQPMQQMPMNQPMGLDVQG